MVYFVPISVVAYLLLACGARSQTTEVITLVPKPVVVKVGFTSMPVLNRPVQASSKMPLSPAADHACVSPQSSLVAPGVFEMTPTLQVQETFLFPLELYKVLTVGGP